LLVTAVKHISINMKHKTDISPLIYLIIMVVVFATAL